MNIWLSDAFVGDVCLKTWLCYFFLRLVITKQIAYICSREQSSVHVQAMLLHLIPDRSIIDRLTDCITYLANHSSVDG